MIGRYGDTIKVAVTAPPAEGRANRAVVRMIAVLFGVPVNDVSLISGHRSRRKRLFVKGIEEGAARRKLDAVITDRR